MYCDIMQGIPGAGKSTYAKHAYYSSNICSADGYHMVDGVYRFDVHNIGEAHKACMRRFLGCVHDKSPAGYVCVDNTNTTLEEMVPYVRVAQAMGYQVTVYRFVCDIDTSVARNTHGVPRAAIERMHARLATPPKAWGVTYKVVGEGYRD